MFLQRTAALVTCVVSVSPEICWRSEEEKQQCCQSPEAKLDGGSCFNAHFDYRFCCAEPATWQRAKDALASGYARWQASKLDKEHAPVSLHEIDRTVEHWTYVRFNELPEALEGKTVLCVGARLGGEVRAFTRLGALAVGVDFYSDQRNLFVLPGDAHNLQFADAVFDHVYTNILDHVERLDVFLAEARRVLRPGGHLWLDVSRSAPQEFELHDFRTTSSRMKLLQMALCKFHLSDLQLNDLFASYHMRPRRSSAGAFCGNTTLDTTAFDDSSADAVAKEMKYAQQLEQKLAHEQANASQS